MPPEATQQGATTDRLMGILGWSDAEKPDETNPTPEAADEAKPEEDKEVTQDTESTEGKPEEDAEAVEQTEDAEEAPLPTTLTELAERIGLDPEKLFEIKAKTKIDGQEGEVTLAQLLKSYQLEGHLTRKSMELSERQKALEAEAQKRESETKQKLQSLEDSLAIAGNILNERYKNVNWDELKAQDPNLFNTTYIEYQQHQQRLNAAYQTLQSEKQKANLADQQQFAEYLEGESKALLNKVPEWTDENVSKKERIEIREYLKGIGFSNEEIGQVYDHRLVLVVRDAVRAKRLATSKPEIMKKVTQAPKLVKPGTKSTKQEAQTDRLRDLRKQHKAGNKQAGIAWLKESGIV